MGSHLTWTMQYSRSPIHIIGQPSCRKCELSRGPERIDARARRQAPRPVNLCAKRFIRSGRGNMAPDHPNRQLPSVFLKRDEPALISLRRRKARRRNPLAKALNTRTKWASINANLAAGRGYRVLSQKL